MDNTTKEQIRTELSNYVSKFDSLNKAGTSLRNVSIATISNILNQKSLEKVSDEMWRNLANQIGLNENWQVVPTFNYQLLSGLFTDAALYQNVLAIIGDASVGKTEAAKQYGNNHKNVYLVRCDEFWNRRTFLTEILHAMGLDAGGYTVPDMMATAVKHILKVKNPILILDEIDKVNDNILCSVISIYNRIEGNCGMVLMATDHLERRLDRGLRLNKKGYKELYSRLGKKLIPLDATTRKDIEAIILANGISNPETIAQIYNDSDNDLRRVKRLVHTHKMKGAKNA